MQYALKDDILAILGVNDMKQAIPAAERIVTLSWCFLVTRVSRAHTKTRRLCLGSWCIVFSFRGLDL